MIENSKKPLDDLTVDGDIFIVLINDEEQYSIWPAGNAVPEGWSRIGPIGPKAECLAFVESNWIDMRPRSLRDAMDSETGK
jgi:MbtH protein